MANPNYSGGNATVLTPFLSGITNTFAREQQKLANQEAQEAKRLQTEQAELASLMKKANLNGVQAQHLPELANKLTSAKEIYYKANKATTDAERLALKLDLQSTLMDLESDVLRSKEYGKDIIRIGEEFVKKPELYSTQSRKLFQENINKPLSQLKGNEFQVQTYISPDTSILGKTEGGITKDLWGRAGEQTTYGKTVVRRQTGDIVTETFKTKSINPDDIGKALFKSYGDNSGYRNIIDLQAQELGMTPQQVLLERSKALAELNKPTREQGWFRNSRPRQESSGSSSDNEGFVIEDNFDINYGSKTKGKTATVTAREYVSLPSSSTVSAGKFNMQDTEGNQYSGGNTAEEIKLVSVGTFPVLKTDRKAGKDTVKAGSMATKSYAEKDPTNVEYVPKAVVNIKDEEGNTTTYFADPREVIARTKLTKAQKTALDAYTTKAMSKNLQPTKTTPTKKTGKGELD